MTIYDIVTYPDKFLEKPTKPVANIDGQTQKVIDNMATTMYAAPGIGLAAIQVGIDQRMLIYDIEHPEGQRTLSVLINPRIVASEGEVLSEQEGCLSVPDFRADVMRAAQVSVEGFDRDGNPINNDAEGLLALELQHELDHLDGTLFIDRISALKRQLYKRKRLKQLKAAS